MQNKVNPTSFDLFEYLEDMEKESEALEEQPIQKTSKVEIEPPNMVQRDHEVVPKELKTLQTLLMGEEILF